MIDKSNDQCFLVLASLMKTSRTVQETPQKRGQRMTTATRGVWWCMVEASTCLFELQFFYLDSLLSDGLIT